MKLKKNQKTKKNNKNYNNINAFDGWKIMQIVIPPCVKDSIIASCKRSLCWSYDSYY